MSWGPPADIWNVGALTWYLVKGKRLFPRPSDQVDVDNRLKHTAHLVAILGPPPEQFLARSEATSQYFDLNGNWVAAEYIKVPETTFEQQETRLQGEQKHLFIRFIRSMLSWLPEERKTAKELLDDPWLNSNAGT